MHQIIINEPTDFITRT